MQIDYNLNILDILAVLLALLTIILTIVITVFSSKIIKNIDETNQHLKDSNDKLQALIDK